MSTETIPEQQPAAAQVDRVVLLLDRIAKAEGYKAGSWGKVVEAAKKYAMMKAHGSYLEDGRMVRVCGSDRERYEKMFADQVMYLSCDALAEDSVGLQ